VVVVKHAEHQVDGQDTESSSATAGRRRKKSSSRDQRNAENMGWTCIKEREFIAKSHRRKNTRKTNERKKQSWNVVWTDRKRRLCKPQKKAQDRNQWRNWIMKNEGQEPAH